VSTPRLAAVVAIFTLASNFLYAEENCGDVADQDDQTRYELRNVSGHHSPIQIDGYLTLRDDAAAHVRVYWVHALARNVAKNKISYWSVGFETTGSEPGLNFTQSNDYFFTGDVFAPGQTAKVLSCPIRLVIRPANEEPPAERGDSTAPTASARVKFVQFSDGSTWGDRDDAAQVHQLRRATRDKFESLQKLYSESGAKAFMDALEEPTGLPCFEQIKSQCQSQNGDSNCVRKGIQQMLVTAAQQRNLEAD